MYLLASLLVVTSTSQFGLLAVWAAISPVHWFVRTAIAAGFVSLLLLIPAHDLVLCFALQMLCVAGVIGGLRSLRHWRDARKANAGGHDWFRRFSLQTLLLVVVVVAGLSAVFPRLLELEPAAKSLSISMGIHAGAQTLLATWIVFGRLRIWLRIPVAIAVSLGSLPALRLMLEVYYYGTVSVMLYSAPEAFGEFIESLLPFSGWLTIVGFTLTILATSVILLELFAAGHLLCYSRVEPDATQRGQRKYARICALAFTLLLAVFPVYIYQRLLRPARIPDVVMPVPNAYDALEAAGVAVLNNAVFDAPDTVSTAILRSEIAKHQASLSEGHRALELECRKSQNYVADWLPYISAWRSLARAWIAEGELAKREGDFAHAVEHYGDVVRLGPAMAGGGLMIDGMVGCAIEGSGLASLQDIAPSLVNDDRQQAIDLLLKADAAWDDADDFYSREKVFMEHAFGWSRRLDVAFMEFDPTNTIGMDQSSQAALQRINAFRRLLMAELAIDAYRADHQRPPDCLEDLLHRYLPYVPRDPYADRSLSYRVSNGQHLLYCLGPDGVDNAGRPLTYQELIAWKSGDVVLQSLREPYP